MLSGAFDAQTPASGGAKVAETLSNATVETIPGEAHGTFFESECAAQLITSFFDDPDGLDTSCVEEVEPAAFSVE